MTAHRAKRKRWMELIGLLEAMEAGSVPFDEGSRKVIELARDLGIADHHYVRPFYGTPLQQEMAASTTRDERDRAELRGIGHELMRQAAPKLLRYAREHAI